MKRFLSVFLLAAGLLSSMASNSATVYSESFTGINNGTALNRIQPTIGQAWSVTGSQSVQGHAITVTTNNLAAYGPFTSALASGTLTFSVNFSTFTCSGSSSNMGVNLSFPSFFARQG